MKSRTTAIAGAVAVPVVVATLLSGFLVAIDRWRRKRGSSTGGRAPGSHHYAIYRLGGDGRQIFPRHRSEAFFLTGG